MQIEFGCFAKSLSQQLHDAGMKQTGEKIGILEKCARAIYYAHIHDVIKDSEYDRCLKRILKKLHPIPISEK